MPEQKAYIGIDIGSASLKMVVLDSAKKLIGSDYILTDGEPFELIRCRIKDLIHSIPVEIKAVAATGTGKNFLRRVSGMDTLGEVVAVARGVSLFNKDINTVIEIGGQDSKLLMFSDKDARYTDRPFNFYMNESCAAGTGLFMQQVSAQIGVPLEAFDHLCTRSSNLISIAGRCAAIIKTNIVHGIQEGNTLEDTIAGLCYSLARNFLHGVVRGRVIDTPVAFIGGVAAIQGMVEAFRSLLKLNREDFIVPRHYLLMGAIGAALFAMDGPSNKAIYMDKLLDNIDDELRADKVRAGHLRPLKQVRKSMVLKTGCNIKNDACDSIYIGIDSGSSALKIVAIDNQGRIYDYFYELSKGLPKQTLERGLSWICSKLNTFDHIKGSAATGSGRYLVDHFIGVDILPNEIFSLFTAVKDLYPEIDTIFEIGGQDSKLIILNHETISYFDLNKVCSAGTGSFLQELSNKLGITKFEEFDALAFKSKQPADYNFRCTVFIESALIHYQQQGVPKEDLIAGLAYSIARNYLRHVVKGKKLGEKIGFFGGVALYNSVISAFEDILNAKILVPKEHAILGAYGAALLAKEALESGRYQKTCFLSRKGKNAVSLIHSTPDFRSKQRLFSIKAKHLHYPDLFKEREGYLLNGSFEDAKDGKRRIGIPRALLFYEYFPLWKGFFSALGYQFVPSLFTNERFRTVSSISHGFDACMPIKLLFSHIEYLISQSVDYIFIPSIVDFLDLSDKDQCKSYYCPYIQTISYLVQNLLQYPMIIPSINRLRDPNGFSKEMFRIGAELGHGQQEIDSALRFAIGCQNDFYKKCDQRGQTLLKELQDIKMIPVVILSRPYITHDSILNLDLLDNLRNLDILPIPMDFLPIKEQRLATYWRSLVWRYNQDCIRVIDYIKRQSEIYSILLTCYGCGPDAFFLNFLEDIMEDRPHLTLEFDEHTFSAGMITRCEAFADLLRKTKKPYPKTA